MVAEHEEIIAAALAKSRLVPIETGVPSLGKSFESALVRASWGQVQEEAGLAEQICKAIVAEINRVLFSENNGYGRRLTLPMWRQYVELGVGYYLGLYRDAATDIDVREIEWRYNWATKAFLEKDTDARLKQLRAAVSRAIEGEAQVASNDAHLGAPVDPLSSTVPAAASVPDRDTEVHTEPAAPPQPRWNYLPLPEGEGLDPHTEYAAIAAPGVGGFKLIGARVRGKKHKHEGTHCDDWFEFGSAGAWNLVAVSDGAGSKKYSRVGAKSACEAAIQLLRKELAAVRITVPSKTDLNDFFARKADGTFKTDDVERVQRNLHRAMQAAHGAVEDAYKERMSEEQRGFYEKALERKLELADLSCTLLLAVQTEFTFKGQEYSFILACQVGDGMIAAIYNTAGGMAAAALGSADSGEFSGETEFLTSTGKVEEQNLRQKTQSLICRLNTLMVMTDGVADDYFPNSTEAPRLLSDLMLTGVLGSSENANLSSEDRDLIAQAKKADYVDVVQTVEQEPKDVSVASAKRLSETLGQPMSVLINKPAVLAELAIPISDGPPEERLRQWIDTYQVRGSFDDRTLVLLHKGGSS